MEVIRVPGVMRQTAKGHLLRGRTIGFVPTMGALHRGHLSLVSRCREENDVAVVSIFVNPAQFGPSEDYQAYPRDVEGDMEKLRAEGVDVLFIPDVDGMYPEGFATYVEVEGLSERLCGAFRPGHFRGVATVVTKLLNIVRPTRAYFGLKDYQQAVIIRRLIADLDIDTEMVGCPTVREDDGLAMSSRNLYLSPAERKAATVIYRTLCQAEEALLSGGKGFAEVRSLMERGLAGEPLVKEVQYASLFDPWTLADISSMDANIYRGRTVLLAAAVVIGRARLIDNKLVEVPGVDQVRP